MLRNGWCLVFVIWGEKYSDAYVNVALRSARLHSPDLAHAVMFSDRPRPGIDPFVVQRPFPDFFARPDCFAPGYIAKLSMFSRPDLPPDMRCLFLDLDTVVMGDLGKIAALVHGPDDVLMLPPGNLLGFGRVRRLIYRLSGGRRFATGNSSIVAYSSAASPNLCETYERLHGPETEGDIKLKIDDLFLSWFAQPHLRAVPQHLAVMFRREFLSRSALSGWLKSRLGPLLGRRKRLVAITLNGMDNKPEALLALPDGARIADAKGRFGYWSEQDFGSAKAAIVGFCREVTSATRGNGIADSSEKNG